MTDTGRPTVTLRARLSIIQRTLDVPKTHYNAHGGFYYRNAEDILDAVKKLLIDGETIETGDVIENIGDRYYCKATAYFANETEMISKDAYAREAEEQKGMQSSQLSGSTSSYARKYALNGLFAIDDVKDADSMDNTKDLISTHTTVRTPEGTISTPKQEESNAPVRPEAPYCTEHKQYYYKQEKNGKVWYSHRNVDDTWCNMK